MQKNECVGCKTHFQQGSKLPLQGISLQLKYYPLPIKDQKHRWNLLRTICSFLNSKGGTIFIGAQDNGLIRGYSIQRKELDDFKIFIQQLTQRISPKVDLSDRQDVLVQFIPVLNGGKFLGKYLIKVIVKQGQPSQLYCFSQKIQLQPVNQKKIQEYQIIYSYVRQNSSTIKQYKGYELLNLAKSRAAKPPKVANCFHDNCNPEPLDLNVQILKIGFSNVSFRQTRQIIQQWCQISLSNLGIKNQIISYDKQNQMIVVEFTSKAELQRAQKFVNQNLKQINKALQGQCNFVRKDSFLDCLLYENIQKLTNINIHKQMLQKQKKSEQKKQKNTSSQSEAKKKYVKKSQKKQIMQQQKLQENQQDWEEIEQNEDEKKESVNKKIQQKFKRQNLKVEQQYVQSKAQKIQQKQKNSPKKQRTNKSQNQKKEQSKNQKVTKQQIQKKKKNKSIGKKYSLTFTHINPKLKNQLATFLYSLTESKKNLQVYQNTVEVFLPNQQSYDQFYMNVIEERDTLKIYGFKNQIKFGANTGQIDIYNFDRSKGKQLLTYLKKLMGKQLQKSEIMQNGKNYTISLLMSKQNACQWLDKLLTDAQVKKYQIPGAEKGQKAKIKVHLLCIDQLQQQFGFYGF